jgi:hypothetical protein
MGSRRLIPSLWIRRRRLVDCQLFGSAAAAYQCASAGGARRKAATSPLGWAWFQDRSRPGTEPSLARYAPGACWLVSEHSRQGQHDLHRGGACARRHTADRPSQRGSRASRSTGAPLRPAIWSAVVDLSNVDAEIGGHALAYCSPALRFITGSSWRMEK